MAINLDTNTLNKGAEIMKNVTQVAANLTRANTPKPQEKPKQENMNQPHTQTVEVKVGDQATGAGKPLILKEKSETHVHKVFPDQRELSDRECEVRTLELKNEHEYKMRELEWRMRTEEEARKERKEREARAEEDRKWRRERDRRFARNAGICVGAVCVITAGAVAYSLYTDSRNARNQRLAIPASEVVPAEGSVK